MSESSQEISTNGRADRVPPEPPTVTPLGLLTIALRHRWILAGGLLFGLALGAYRAALDTDRVYSASATFLTHGESSSSPVPSGLARQYGLSQGGRIGESPRFYSTLLQSREILWRAGSSIYEVNDPEKGAFSGTLIELYDWNEGSPEAVRRRTVSRIGSMVSTSARSEVGLVEVSVTASSPEVAEQLAMRLIELAQEFNREYRQSRARSEERFVTEQMDAAQADLSQAEGALQQFLRRNRQFQNSPELTFEHDRLQRVVRMRQDLVTALAQAEQQARIDAVRDTPVITVLESAIGMAQPRGGWTSRPILLGLVAGFFLAIVIIFMIELFRRTRENAGDDYQEFIAVRDEIKRDVTRFVPVRRRLADPAKSPQAPSRADPSDS